MSRTIHGKSHQALRPMRDKPATLAVYWCYVSRMNNEGAAWPSLRGLAHDLGWNKDSCSQARNWLVQHEALERLTDYTRPEWRKLPPEELVRKKALDKAEYYRPTGYIVYDEKSFSLLYNGGDEPSSLDEKTPDVQRGRTSTAPTVGANGRRPDRTELNSSPDLDSSLQGNSTTTPDGERPLPSGKKERKPSPHAPLHDALIAAFGYAPESVTKSADSLFWATAAELARVKVTAAQIPALYAYVKGRAAREQWKSFSVRALAKYAPDWLKQQPAAPANHAAPLPSEIPEFTFAEMQARAKAILESEANDAE